jgi:hypothetical protein
MVRPHSREMPMSWIPRLLFVLSFLMAGALMTHQATSRPALNWDLIGYVASVKRSSGASDVQVHTQTYSAVRAAMSPQDYARLTQGPFRKDVAENPALLAEQLPFYGIRPVYVWLLAQLESLGVDLIKATYLVPATGCLAALLLMGLWAQKRLPAAASLALLPAAWLLGMPEVARLSTPDGLALLAVIASSLAFMSRAWILLCALLPLLVGIRTDLILWVAPLGLAIAALAPRHKKAFAGMALLLAVGTYGWINWYHHNPGWAVIFKFTLISNAQPPSTLIASLTWGEYSSVLLRETKMLLANKAMLFYATVLLLAGHLAWVELKAKGFKAWMIRPENLLQAVCLVFIGAHFVAFPAAWERFFCAPQIVSMLCLLVALHRSAGTRSNT